jgi:hypothetical protein
MSRIDAGEQSRRNAAKEAKGGGTQFYIPNLKVAHIKTHSFNPL